MLSKKIVKYIQSLTHKKFRDEEGLFIAEGPKVVEELLEQKKFQCTLICAEKNWLSKNEALLKQLPSQNIFETDEVGLKSISLRKAPNQVLGIFMKSDADKIPPLVAKITLMLDYLQDPGNMGTIIRIADWFGIANIICSRNSVDCYNPKVVQSTMGSLSRVNIFYTDLKEVIEKNINIPVYATSLSGTSVFKLPKITEGIILIGNEAKGVHEDLLKLCSKQITIPRKGKAESLNAAVATGIILSQIIAKR